MFLRFIVGHRLESKRLSCMPRISKKARFPSGSSPDPERVGDYLLDAAKRFPEVRMAMAKALLRPSSFFRFDTPRISNRELATAIRVAELVISSSLSDNRKSERWKGVQNGFVALLRHQISVLPPLLQKDVDVTRRVLDCLPDSWVSDRDSLRKDLQQFRQTRLPRLPPRGLPHRGRWFSGHSQRTVAAYQLLRVCGEKRNADKVAALLYQHGKEMQADNVTRLVSRYRAALNKPGTGVFIPLGQLPEHWLNNLGSWLLSCADVQKLRQSWAEGWEGFDTKRLIEFFDWLAQG